MELGIKAVAGDGIGRYGSAQLADLTLRPDGTEALIRTVHGLGALELHPTPKLDLYAYYGAEYAFRAAYTGYDSITKTITAAIPATATSPAIPSTTATKISTTGIGGYGSPFANNSGCSTENPPINQLDPSAGGTCAGDTKRHLGRHSRLLAQDLQRPEGWSALGYPVLLLLADWLVGEQQRADGAGYCAEGRRQHGLHLVPLLHPVTKTKRCARLQIAAQQQAGAFSLDGNKMRSNFCPGANLIRTSRRQLISLVQIPKYFDQVPRAYARFDINPFRVILLNTNYKAPLQIAGDR